jgi:hypothetical protein
VTNPENLPVSDESPRSPALSALLNYLRASGWTMEDQDQRTSMWRPAQDRDNLRLVLPVHQNVSDYDDRVLDALRLLSYVERRSLEEVGGDIVYGPADTVAIWLTPDAPSGQAPLSLAYEAVAALRSYVIGSGAALHDRSLVLPARRSRQAETYASAARFATRPGSFVLTLTLPLLETPEGPEPTEPHTAIEDAKTDTGTQPELLHVPPQPFGRRVTNRMASVARYAQNLSEEINSGNQKLPVFGQLHAESPNATELEALSTLGGADRSPYKMRFAQSPLASQRLNQVTLRVTPGQQRVMAEAAEYLRTKQSRSDVTVEGFVVNLSRDRHYGPGEVIVQGVVDDSGKARRFHTELTESDYGEAIRAHSQGLQVVVRGDSDTRGTWKWIRPLRGFAIMPGFEYDDD